MAEPAVRDGSSATSPQLDKAVPQPPSSPDDQETAQDPKLTEELAKVDKVIQSEVCREWLPGIAEPISRAQFLERQWRWLIRLFAI